MQIHQFDRATSAENTDLFPISRSGRVYAITEENLVNATADKVNELLATKKGTFTGNIDNISETSVYWVRKQNATGTFPTVSSSDPYFIIETQMASDGIRIQKAYRTNGQLFTRLFQSSTWSTWDEYTDVPAFTAEHNAIDTRLQAVETFSSRTRLVSDTSDTRTLTNGLTIVGNKIGRTVQLYIFVTSAYNASTNPNGGLTEALASGSGAVSIFPTGAAKLPEAFQPLVSMVNYTVLALANGGIIGQLNVRGDGDIQISGTRGITDGVTKDLAVHTNLYANMMYLSKS